MNYQFRPIEKWPRDMTHSRRRAPFKAQYSSTMKLLERELRCIGVSTCVIQLALLPSQITRDGLPYSKASPTHPGVIISFDRMIGKAKTPLQFPCDAFLAWQENLRAIALALEALRKVDRYGVTKHAEQYRGWSQLPGPIIVAGMNAEDAAEFVSEHAGGAFANAALVLKNAEAFQSCYRQAALRLHPDAAGDVFDQQRWDKLQLAAEVLKAHHDAAASL